MRPSKKSNGTTQMQQLKADAAAERAAEKTDPLVQRLVREALKRIDKKRTEAQETKRARAEDIPLIPYKTIDDLAYATRERVLLELWLWSQRRQDFMFISALRFEIFGCFWTVEQYDSLAAVLLSLHREGLIKQEILVGAVAYTLTNEGRRHAKKLVPVPEGHLSH